MLRIYDVGSKLLNRIKGMYVDSQVKYIMSPWLLNAYMDAVMNDLKMRIGRRGEGWDCLGSCIQTTWFCVVSRRKT